MKIKCRQCPNQFEERYNKRLCDNCIKQNHKIQHSEYAKSQNFETRFIYRIRTLKYKPNLVIDDWIH